MNPKAPIFVVSRFRSGSSFLWNLFRKDPRYRCYYEPFHDNLAESVEINRSAMESHRGISSYWDEYRDVARDLPAIHRPQFGISDLLLRPGDKRPEFVQFIRHLIRAAERDGRICMIKCNRLDFRLPWLRAHFPAAKIIYIHRNPRDQWISSVRPHKPELWDRLEENIGYDLPAWISSLAPDWPFLLEGPPRPAYYYSHMLSMLSREFGERYADVTLDFDRDVADEPANLAKSLASFFAKDFFKQPDVQALIKPTRPGTWRKFRTEEWFSELEIQSERTLKQAGVRQPAFWRWPAATKTGARKPDHELHRAIDLALLMFSRHRADLLVHGHQLQAALDVARKHAESLSSEYEKSRDTLKTTESQRSELDSKHRLLQAVYDSLKQAHDISISSLSKTLEEFQYATKELRQLIAYKDAQLLQLTDSAAETRKLLTDSPLQPQLDGLTAQLADARKVEQTLRQELENSRIGLVKLDGTAKAELAEARAAADRLRSELTAAKAEALEGKNLKKHAMALEAASTETWTELSTARKQLAAGDAQRALLEARLQAGQSELAALAESERSAKQRLATAADRAEALAETITAHEAIIRELQGDRTTHAEAIKRREQEIATLRDQFTQVSSDLTTATDRAEALAKVITAHEATIRELQRGAITSHDDAKVQEEEIATLRNQLTQESDEKAALIAALTEARAELDTHHALKVHVSTLELAHDESWRLIVDLRTQLAGLSAQCETLERERTTRDTAFEERTQQLAAELDQARQRIGTVEERVASEARQNADLTRWLQTEQTAKTTEKAAYEQRTVIHVTQLKEVHQLLDSTKAQLQRRDAELQGRITTLSEQLSTAHARLTALEQSWASSLIQRLAPAAFKPSNSP